MSKRRKNREQHCELSQSRTWAPRRRGQDRTQRPGSSSPPRPTRPEDEHPGTPGRPKVILDAKDYEQAELCAGFGLTKPQTAGILGIALRTFERLCVEDADLVAALARGQAVAAFAVAQALFRRAVGDVRMVRLKGKEVEVYTLAPDVNAIRWYEQTRCGRWDVVRTEVDDVADLTTMEEREARVRGILSLGLARAEAERRRATLKGKET